MMEKASQENELMAKLKNIFEREKIVLSDLQKKILAAHIQGVVRRWKVQERLPEMEEQLFCQVEEGSQELARQVFEKKGVQREEILLLAMHIENARIQ